MTDDNMLIRTDDDGVAVLTLNAPKSINALSEDMIAALSHMLDEIAEDRSIRAVVLRGEGKHFCAGHNLKEMTARRQDADGGFQYFQDLFAACSAMMLRVVRLPQPVIAEVTGIATAAGCQLVASGDRDGCGLSVGGVLRSCGGGRGGEFRHEWCEHRIVLLNPYGGAQPECAAQAGDGNAVAWGVLARRPRG